VARARELAALYLQKPEVAATAGVGKQTIYRWWPSKAAVVFDALEREIKSVHPPPRSGSTYEDIHTQMSRVAEMFASPTGSIIRELVAESLGDDKVAKQFEDRFFAERLRLGLATLQSGVDGGVLRPDLDLEIVAEMLYGPLWLRMIIRHQPLEPEVVTQILDYLWPTIAFDNHPSPSPDGQ
jgi:AcrR family transcriptional regulator